MDGPSLTHQLEALDLLTGAKRAGDWSRPLPLSGLSVDSRKVKAGQLFAALPGTVSHGAEFIPDALERGAGVILTDAAGLEVAERQAGKIPVPMLIHPDPRLALARASARWFVRQPEVMVAVTGTNGKTSVASFTRQIWEELGACAVNFGTTGVEGAVSEPLSHTTPEPITLHALLARLADQGVTHAAMEASSHGLAQRRLDGVRLAAGAFTNISRDHLDYHPDFEAYFAAKCGLFERVIRRDGIAVLNIDDSHVAALAKRLTAGGQEVISVGAAKGATLRHLASRFDNTGQELRFAWNGKVEQVRLDLIGGFQAHNALLAAGLAIATGYAPGDVFRAMSRLKTVRGRMQRAATRANGASVYVDFAHTPDALATALQALRPHVMGRLIVVFGAGGDRDRGKRPLMGLAAAKHAELVIVTDDNPRTEDAAAIRAEIMAAIPQAREIGDRAKAILTAIDMLAAGDTLLIAGKGHESGQIIGHDVLPFDDAEQASVAVAALEGRGA